MTSRKIELLVGVFIAIGISAFLILALKVADSSMSGNGEAYYLKARFDNIGGLKVRSPVKVGGVVVGRVSDIALDSEDYTPVVTIKVDSAYNNFPETSSMSILTSGMLGEQYIGLQPGFVDEDIAILQDGDFIEDTKSAMVLEDLIGQFLFSQSED